MKLETKRLILRTPKLSDAKELSNKINNKEIARQIGTIPYPYKLKDAKKWIKESIKKSKKKKPKTIEFLIFLKEDNELVGGTALSSIDYFSKIAVTGSWIAKKHWKKGFVTEAKVVVNDFAFNKLKLRKLASKVITTNKASNIMIKKSGYKLEGTTKEDYRVVSTKKWHDTNFYGIFKADWKKVRPKIIKKLKKY